MEGVAGGVEVEGEGGEAVVGGDVAVEEGSDLEGWLCALRKHGVKRGQWRGMAQRRAGWLASSRLLVI